MIKIEADDLGWSIDLPCLNCEKMCCPGGVYSWVPNRTGNMKDGFSSEEEALAYAKTLQQSHKILCDLFKGV